MTQINQPTLLSGVGLTKTYGSTPALKSASVEIKRGEILAVMGPSGSGKSTLLHCLAGVVQPDQGRVIYRGQDVTAMSDRERSALRRTEFGFIFQFGQLVPELSCIENVSLPLRLSGLSRKDALARALVAMQRLEVASVRDKLPGEVSGGQGQRVAVARALVAEPTVIFADEPTGALDSLNGERVMRMLAEVAKEHNIAVLLVTHEPRVAGYSTREIVFRDGRDIQLEMAA